jgi:hypothetical protein
MVPNDEVLSPFSKKMHLALAPEFRALIQDFKKEAVIGQKFCDGEITYMSSPPTPSTCNLASGELGPNLGTWRCIH